MTAKEIIEDKVLSFDHNTAIGAWCCVKLKGQPLKDLETLVEPGDKALQLSFVEGGQKREIYLELLNKDRPRYRFTYLKPRTKNSTLMEELYSVPLTIE